MGSRVAVIGGGISGLAAAHRLIDQDPSLDLLLLEASDRLGGVLETTRRDGFLIEAAADNFLTTPPAAVDLCRRVGLGDELLGTDPARRQAFVVHDGRLQPIPAGFQVMAPSQIWPVLTSPILSLWGKLRLALEPFVPRREGDNDESLASFVCRRFGQQVFDRLVQPLVGGIYTADPYELSLDATMPRFSQMEREYGSLILAMLRAPSAAGNDKSGGARYGQFAALSGGMSSLVDAIAEHLPPHCVRLGSPVDAIVPREGGRWWLAVGGKHRRAIDVDGLILAASAHRAALLLEDVDAELAEELRQIEYASCAVVSLAYRRDQIEHPLDGFGFVVPLVEQRTILSCSFSSLKYKGRAPDETVLLRVFIGGACQSGLLRLPKELLLELAEREVADLLHVHGEPILSHVKLHGRAMPQYQVGHRDRVARVNDRLQAYPTLALAGNALSGVGVPACIESGNAAAERLRTALIRSPVSLCSAISKEPLP